MELLFLIFIPTGLLLDVVGCLIIIQNGDFLNTYFGVGPPPPELGEDGDKYVELDDIEAVKAFNKKGEIATWGISLLTAGFILQIIGAIGAILAHLELLPS